MDSLLHDLKQTVFGDGNSNKGLVRRVDQLEYDVKQMQRDLATWKSIARTLFISAVIGLGGLAFQIVQWFMQQVNA